MSRHDRGPTSNNQIMTSALKMFTSTHIDEMFAEGYELFRNNDQCLQELTLNEMFAEGYEQLG